MRDVTSILCVVMNALEYQENIVRVLAGAGGLGCGAGIRHLAGVMFILVFDFGIRVVISVHTSSGSVPYSVTVAGHWTMRLRPSLGVLCSRGHSRG